MIKFKIRFTSMFKNWIWMYKIKDSMLVYLMVSVNFLHKIRVNLCRVWEQACNKARHISGLTGRFSVLHWMEIPPLFGLSDTEHEFRHQATRGMKIAKKITMTNKHILAADLNKITVSLTLSHKQRTQF